MRDDDFAKGGMLYLASGPAEWATEHRLLSAVDTEDLLCAIDGVPPPAAGCCGAGKGVCPAAAGLSLDDRLHSTLAACLAIAYERIDDTCCYDTGD